MLRQVAAQRTRQRQPRLHGGPTADQPVLPGDDAGEAGRIEAARQFDRYAAPRAREALVWLAQDQAQGGSRRSLGRGVVREDVAQVDEEVVEHVLAAPATLRS